MEKDEGGTGQYPPPTLHALLDIYLLDNIDEAAKHAIVIYLLLDVMYSFPNKDGASVESFPPAFAIPVGLVKLVQGLWLLDHHDHQRAFELLLHPAASQCQFEWQHERVLQALMCQGQHSVALRYFHNAKPLISSTSQAKLCLSVLLHNRCLIDAWSLLRQHSNRLNMGELLGFLYESCQELGLIKELLKLPLGLTEQECLEKFLQGRGGLPNRELLMVHYLQQANYIPALQLNHSLKMNLVNERDPKLKERSNTRNSILDQYGKVLPRVQRKLAMERAKPYQHPYTIHKEVIRPQPLSTITKRSASEKVMSRAGFINNVLTKIEEVWLGKGATPQSSPAKTPRAADIQSPSPRSSTSVHPDPFLGTPITMTSKRKSRLMDLVVHPSCQSPQPLLSTPRHPSSWVSPKSISKAPELSLLQTPQVVKRARALAASGPVFSAFTPQSILRSSLRPTPVATPSASPGRSITPPLRSKENRITFIEETESPEPEKGIRWTNGMAADSEISLLTRASTLSKATGKTWSSQPAEEEEDGEGEREQPHVKFLPPEGGIPSPELRCSESESSSVHEVAADTGPSDATQTRLTLSFDTSHNTPVRSTDTTLEYYDAPLLADQEEEEEGHMATEKDEEVVTLNIKPQSEMEEPEEKLSPTTEQTSILTSEYIEEEKEETKGDEVFENAMEFAIQQEAKTGEDVQSEKEDVELSSKQEDAGTLDHEEIPSDSEVCNQVTESIDFGPEVEFDDQPAEATEQDVQLEAADLTEHLKPSAAVEPTNELEDELEQSTDLTEFVQRHLFGSDLSPPLTRSGIHNASQAQMSYNSESLGEVEEQEQAAAEAPPAFTSQKSNASVTSSEPTGTDSHSVVSVNDSEELSSAESEEEEEEEEDDDDEEESDQAEEEEEEDSGSEVEIIEEVQGNGRLPPLQPSSVFVQQGHTHFLPSLSEQEAAEFSLLTPGPEMKMVEEEMEGEVVMVRLGADEGGMETEENEEQGSSYMELKPSTTLLVPLELVEGQHSLVDSAQLCLPEIQHMVVPDDPRTESQSSFSLMLDMDEDGDKDADTLPMENDLQSSSLSTQSPVEEASEEPEAKPEVILLGTDDQETPLSGEVLPDNQKEEMDTLDGIELDGFTDSELVQVHTYQHTESTGASQEPESVVLPEAHEPEAPSVPAPVEELPAVVDDDVVAKKDAADEETGEEETRPTPAEDQVEPEENLPLNIDAEIVPSPETVEPVPAEEEELKDQRVLAETEQDNTEEITKEKETERRTRGGQTKDDAEEEPVQQELSSINKPEEQPVLEMPTSQRKKAPSTPTRRTTRGRRTVTFISPLPEEEGEPEQDVKVDETETSALEVPASARRTPRKSKQIKEINIKASTPRRSTRKAQLEPPKEEAEEEEAADTNTKASSPARRRASQRATSTRTSQRTGTGSEEVSTATEEERDQEEEEVTHTKPGRRTTSKTPTPAKRRTAQASTPRRSRRRILSSDEVETTTLEIVNEEKEQEEASAPPVKRSSRKTQVTVPEEEEDKKEQDRSPGRTTRQSNRITLNVYPQVKLVPVSLPQSARKTKRETITENIKESEDLLESELHSNTSHTNPGDQPGANSGTIPRRTFPYWTLRWRWTLKPLSQMPSSRGSRMRRRNRKEE
ncbi:hypothetical protein INR49_001457 [Caranx melampygus]|nr:hypothetical protein INR49_001457 [Caranx melampygus]